jgi:hypothetical protein
MPCLDGFSELGRISGAILPCTMVAMTSVGQ